MYSVFGVKASIIYKIDATPYDITGSEGWAVGLAAIGLRVKECVTIITMVTVGTPIPTCKQREK